MIKLSEYLDVFIENLLRSRLFDFLLLSSIIFREHYRAHNSQYIYITHNNSPLFFSIFDNGKNLPRVDYVIIKDHEKSTSHPNKLHAYIWFTNSENKAVELQDITIKLKSQLRSGYAERFQSIAGQYTSRIGVDYISAEVP